MARSEGGAAGHRPLVAIVGAGFSGSATAFHLLREANGPVEVVLIDAAARVGRGLAYSTSSDSHLLNVPAGRLGLDPDNESHFIDWLQRQRPAFRAEDFVPRHWLGTYVRSSLHEAANGARLRVIDAQVTRIVRQADGHLVEMRDGTPLVADHVVLATGHGPAVPPRADGDATWSDAGMVADPWTSPPLVPRSPHEDVLIIGTGLTAIDIVAQWTEAGFAGRVHMLSRHGLLPQPHRANETRPAAGAAPLPMPAAGRSLRGLVAAVRDAVREAQRAGADWRDVMARLRPITPELWRGLDDRDRRRFLRHLQPLWDVHRHRIAPAVHARLREAVDSGRIRVHAGRLLRVDRRPDGSFEARWRARATQAPVGVVVQAIVNCTGPTTAAADAGDPLLSGLLQSGGIARDPLGLGLALDDDLRPIAANGAAGRGLHYVGPMLKAARWEAVAIPELRVHARDTARRVLDAIAERLAAVD